MVCFVLQAEPSQSQSAYFLPEFALSPKGSFLEDTTGEQYLTYRYDDQVYFRHVLCNVSAAHILCSLSMPLRPGWDQLSANF